MHKISVPIMSSTVNEGNREIYARLCREAGAERVFLCSGSILEAVSQSIRENVAYFKSQGFTVGIWTDTIGHGKVLDHVEGGGGAFRFPLMVDLDGAERPYAYCPTDAGFRRHVARHVAALAGTGADIVMLDDDFRMSQHGDALCCACDRHLARISELVGEEVTLDALRPQVLSGKANRYRDAWLKAQNEGLVLLAWEIRAEIDRRHPDVTVCFCTAFSPWNVDGTDIKGIARILAGRNRPILRLTGAPYWAVKKRRFPLITVFEIARMLASFVSGEGFELMSEGDVYPRPRYTCPSSYLELYDAVMRADGGYDGILKYMIDYVAGPSLETGYLRLHAEDAPLFSGIERFFGDGANAGVRIVARPHTVKDADLSLSTLSQYSPRPLDGSMLGACGIPTVYRGEGICNSVFGENARLWGIREDGLFDRSVLSRGTVLDAVSAVILSERGVDVGLRAYGTLEKRTVSFLSTEDPEYKSFITDGGVRMLSTELSAGCVPLLWSDEPSGRRVVAYRYENAEGERFLVFLVEGDSVSDEETRICESGLMRNPALQRVLVRALPWVGRAPLPAYCEGNPDLYLTCRKDGDSLSVGLFNCFADRLVNPVIVLGEKYDRIECVGCEAELRGDRVVLTGGMYGFTFAAFRATKGRTNDK